LEQQSTSDYYPSLLSPPSIFQRLVKMLAFLFTKVGKEAKQLQKNITNAP
jgi:lauroyl/myristoyl acyltransferase